MTRLTTDKPVSEMGGYELAHNCCYIQNGVARYRDYGYRNHDRDIDARDLARHLMEHNGYWNNYGDDSPITNRELLDDDIFDETMIDQLMLGEEDLEGLIAIFYRLIWAMADLRETLKDYEDTGLSPSRIIEMDQLYLEKCQEVAKYKPLEGYTYEGQQLYIKRE